MMNMTGELERVLKQRLVVIYPEGDMHYFSLVQISPGGFLRACYASPSTFARNE